MNDKSHVGLEQHVCVVCGQAFDTGNILLDTRLRATIPHHAVTGWGMCPEHQKLKDEGFTALVAVDEAKSAKPVTLETAYRTGQVAHLRNTAWPNVFNVPLPPQGMAFVPPEVIDMLQSMQQGGE